MYSYHNTTNVSGQKLDHYETNAKSQEERIIKYIEANWHNQYWSPSLIHNCVFHDNTPLTSVRRAFTNLAKAGLLLKTDLQKDGPYRRPEYQWTLPTQQRRLF